MLAILNSLGGGEILFILVLALIVLGPEKLPEAMRRFGNIYGELRRMSDGFQSELRDAFHDPMQEMRGTAQWMQDAVRHPMQTMADQLRDTNPSAADPDAVDADGTGEVQAPVEEVSEEPVLTGPVVDGGADRPAGDEVAAPTAPVRLDPQVPDQPVPADIAAAVLPDPEPELGSGPSSTGPSVPSVTRIGELEEADDPFSWVASHDVAHGGNGARQDQAASAGTPVAED